MNLNSLSYKKKFFLVISIFILWMIVSSYWYICGIKNVCDNNVFSSSDVASIFDVKNSTPLDNNSFLSFHSNINFNNNDNNINRNDFISFKINKNKKASFNKIISKKIVCSLYIRNYLTIGTNNKIEVRKLQSYLNQFENENLIIDGIYGIKTSQAVIRMQKNNIKNGDFVIWGSVDKLTRDIINRNICLNEARKK